MHIPERMEVCLQDWLQDRWAYGDLLGMVLAYSLWGSKGAPELMGKGALSRSALGPPEVGILIIKTCFLQH